MNTQELNDVLKLCKSSLVAGVPKVTGRMARSIAIYNMSAVNSKEVAKIVIDVPYARYVNYGYLNHPNSAKLRSDYLLIERIIRNSLRASCSRYGGVVR